MLKNTLHFALLARLAVDKIFHGKGLGASWVFLHIPQKGIVQKHS